MPPPPGVGTRPGSGERGEGSQARLVVIIAVAGLLLVGAFAALYFLVLNKNTEATGPEKAVTMYFDALSAGDTQGIKAAFTTENAPDQAVLEIMEQLLGQGSIKYEDVKLETLSETGTDAEVKLVDFTVVVSMGGQTVRQKMSDLGMPAGTIKMKNVNGVWLINQKGDVSGMEIPSMPGGSIDYSGG